MEFALGVLLAVVYVASPGPVNLATIQRGWAGGFSAALAVHLGALVGDLSYALLALTGLGFCVAQAGAQTLLGIAGASVLLWLGAASLRQGWSPTIHPAAGSIASSRRSFWAGMALAIANPYGVAFWLSIDDALRRAEHSHASAFLGGFFLGGLLVALALAFLVGRLRRHIRPWVLRVASYGFGVVLIGFGVSLGYAAALGY